MRDDPAVAERVRAFELGERLAALHRDCERVRRQLEACCRDCRATGRWQTCGWDGPCEARS